MKGNSLVIYSKWVLILSGALWAYQGLTGTDLLMQILGGLTSTVEIVLFGGAAVYLAYKMLTKKK